jgi:hypothetical protein
LPGGRKLTKLTKLTLFGCFRWLAGALLESPLPMANHVAFSGLWPIQTV